ncbi:bifunctional enoyl-CoA hydratase/phosphate acetyltransferase [Candidatus Cryosericum terrychapinii]|jgi:phosphate butyryltransferase|uniref:Bifunctional enoyl-CoA hydratase/phosphate acetyltransferase n=1 Tax=Candidatus Cryosericum terrychapinii TaxID=2290919 RepID=A0A398CUU5_9BACT|nr:bifunctional enoyl-CoA hydratase/phosphate acetyltransferase [Candidatus Cryosericum terrychapinii]RIE06333.1 bifunctional enoyl-CoA hydratase/phosphate acetyltransferase [Candidatus Cryosericum terrychapinii]
MEIRTFAEVLEEAKKRGRRKLAVVFPEEVSLHAAILAQQAGIAALVLVGQPDRIAALLQQAGASADEYEVVAAGDPVQACRIAVQLAHDDRVDVLLKGGVQTAQLLHAVLDKDTGIRASNVMSECTIYEDTRMRHSLLAVVDGGILVAPTLDEKVESIKNTVGVYHRLGYENPKVAVLAAVETVTEKMPCTEDAAIIARMCERGQIKGCVVDGPLALDNAISPQAASIKGVGGEVAGVADILIVPDIEAGNLLGKSMTYFAGFTSAHVTIGARKPVLVPSRADDGQTKLMSVALGIVAYY